jgi:hypothetical protein
MSTAHLHLKLHLNLTSTTRLHIERSATQAASPLRDGEVMRAFVDETTLLWVLKKKLGDLLIYQDEWGRDFPIEIVGPLDGSVFQRSLVVDEARFLEHYPSAEGARLSLIPPV